MDLYNRITELVRNTRYTVIVNDKQTEIDIICSPETRPCIIIFTYNSTPNHYRLECNSSVYSIISHNIKKYPSVTPHAEREMNYGVNITKKGIITIIKELLINQEETNSQLMASDMTISSHLCEIIKRIDALVKDQKEIAHNAIDLTDWQEAQTQLKQAQASITSLKAWKERIVTLKAEFEQSIINDLEAGSIDKKLQQDAESHNPPQIDIPEVIGDSEEDQPKIEVYDTENKAFPADTEICQDTASLADNEENRKQKAQESSDSEAEIPASDVIRICEDLILKNPFHMAMAFFSQAFSDILAMQESNAHTQFVAPYKLSNGLWIETDHITDDKINQIKDFCSTTII